MLVGELRVEHLIAARPQSRREMDKGHLAGIALGAEHAFAEKRSPQ
jgi:hypothetical protein